MSHELSSISFAAGGEGVGRSNNYKNVTNIVVLQITLDYIGYVAKDPIHDRGLYIMNVVMTTVYHVIYSMSCF